MLESLKKFFRGGEPRPTGLVLPCHSRPKPLAYDSSLGAWKPSECPAKSTLHDGLTVATFNVWFDDYFFETRLRAILQILKESEADVIGLQEVTVEALDVLSKDPWLRDSHFLSDVDGATFRDYGVVLLSKLPIERIEVCTLPGPMERRMVLASFVVNGEPLEIAVVHLESLKTSSRVRVQQLHALFDRLQEARHAVMMGDFNFDPSWPENSYLDPEFVDVWSHLRPGEPGFTEDTDVNRMRALRTGKTKKVRFDRVLLKTSRSSWIAQEIQRLGMTPVSPDQPLVFPSDHFGLICEMAWSGHSDGGP